LAATGAPNHFSLFVLYNSHVLVRNFLRARWVVLALSVLSLALTVYLALSWYRLLRSRWCRSRALDIAGGGVFALCRRTDSRNEIFERDFFFFFFFLFFCNHSKNNEKSLTCSPRSSVPRAHTFRRSTSTPHPPRQEYHRREKHPPTRTHNMELALSGSLLRTFFKSVACLAKIGAFTFSHPRCFRYPAYRTCTRAHCGAPRVSVGGT
jgi:hypothetical protein